MKIFRNLFKHPLKIANKPKTIAEMTPTELTLHVNSLVWKVKRLLAKPVEPMQKLGEGENHD